VEKPQWAGILLSDRLESLADDLAGVNDGLALVGATPLHLLSQTALPLKSPTGAFIAAQPRHSAFRRKQKIQTFLLSRKGSDFLF